MRDEIRPIHSELDYETALAQLEEVFEAREGTPEANRLEVLATLIEAYEDQHHPVLPPDPIAAITFYMEQNNLSRADFGDLIGSRPRATEILKGKRNLSISIIRTLAKAWKIPAEILISESATRRTPRRGRKVPQSAGRRRAHA